MIDALSTCDHGTYGTQPIVWSGVLGRRSGEALWAENDSLIFCRFESCSLPKGWFDSGSLAEFKVRRELGSIPNDVCLGRDSRLTLVRQLARLGAVVRRSEESDSLAQFS